MMCSFDLIFVVAFFSRFVYARIVFVFVFVFVRAQSSELDDS